MRRATIGLSLRQLRQTPEDRELLHRTWIHLIESMGQVTDGRLRALARQRSPRVLEGFDLSALARLELRRRAHYEAANDTDPR